MPGADDLVGLESSFSQVALALFAPGTVEGTLHQIVAVAERTIDGCEAAGVLVLVGGNGAGATVGDTSGLALEIQQMQIDADEGPCLDALRHRSTVYAPELTDDARWPTIGPAAAAAGIRSVLAYSLSPDRPIVLSLYGRFPGAFGPTDRAQGELFATLARLALGSAEERAMEGQRAENLLQALRTREVIGQAQGILMERERISADEAFDLLRRASQRINVKLREVAEMLVNTGETPEPGPPPPHSVSPLR